MAALAFASQFRGTDPKLEEKISQAESLKEEGNAAFKEGNMSAAMGKYHSASMYYEGLQGLDEAQKKRVDALKVSVNLNLAACQLKVGKGEKAIVSCDKVLAIDPKNSKAIFRRGCAYNSINDVDRAKIDLDKALTLVPGDQAIIRELHSVRAKMLAYQQKSREMFAKVGSKLFEGAARPPGKSEEADDESDAMESTSTSNEGKEQTFRMDQ